MSDFITIENLRENLSFFKKMYDSVRFVDPVNKKVIDDDGCNIRETNSICYSYWKRGQICDNCISVRSHNSGKSFIKLEQSDDALMVVTAIPVENTEKPIVVELLKNATESMLIATENSSEGNQVKNIITELNNLIIKDKLTGLFNRRYVEERLPADIIRCVLNNQQLSVIFMDIDNLKEINDTFGHVFGDKAISRVTKIISEGIRKHVDWAARYGGDEFLICLNDTGSEEAYKIADRIRRKTSELKIKTNGKTIRTTASLGVYTANSSSSLTAEEIIALADNRMYEAKKSGKNNTVGFNKYN